MDHSTISRLGCTTLGMALIFTFTLRAEPVRNDSTASTEQTTQISTNIMLGPNIPGAAPAEDPQFRQDISEFRKLGGELSKLTKEVQGDSEVQEANKKISSLMEQLKQARQNKIEIEHRRIVEKHPEMKEKIQRFDELRKKMQQRRQAPPVIIPAPLDQGSGSAPKADDSKENK